MASILTQKIYQFDGDYLLLRDQELTYNQYKKLVTSKNISTVFIYEDVSVVHNNRGVHHTSILKPIQHVEKLYL